MLSSYFIKNNTGPLQHHTSIWKYAAWFGYGLFLWFYIQFLVVRCDLHTHIRIHYNDVIMSEMSSQITGVSIFYSTVCSKKTSKLRVTGLCEGNSLVTGEFPAQRASNAENVSIRWRHHKLLHSTWQSYDCKLLIVHNIELNWRVFAKFT